MPGPPGTAGVTFVVETAIQNYFDDRETTWLGILSVFSRVECPFLQAISNLGSGPHKQENLATFGTFASDPQISHLADFWPAM